MFRFVAVSAMAASAVVGVPAGAQAATHYAESGSKCTIVGTSGNDTLKGTSKKDVICGRGGNDTIVGRDGDDILDGGPGNDKIYGSAGKDRLYGGSGNDRLYGESGSDRIRGGDGADDLYGSTGDDDIEGGEGADRIDGGSGLNACGGSSEDSFKRCRADQADPVFVSKSVSKKTLDVSSGKSVTASVRVRLTDDTGIDFVSFGGGDETLLGPANGLEWSNARLISGSRRDGVWEAVVTARKWNNNGPADTTLLFSDRSGRYGFKDLTGVVTVVGAVPDVTPPTVSHVVLDKTAVDVTAEGATVKVTATIADSSSGVNDAFACLVQPTESGPYRVETCDELIRTSGSTKSGSYSVDLSIAKGALGGEWSVVVGGTDRAGRTANYFDADALASYTGAWPEEPTYSMVAFPAGTGVFTVTGAVDATPAAIDEVILDRSHAADPDWGYLTLRVHATDAAGEGVQSLSIDIADAPEGWEEWGMEMSVLDSGTTTDGWWTVYIPMPGELGLDVSQYKITSVSVSDRFHTREFTLPGNTPDAGAVLLDAAKVTSGGNAWDGVVTTS